MRIIIIFAVLINFISCSNQLKIKKTNNNIATIQLKKIDATNFSSTIELYEYDSSLYEDENLPPAIFDTKVAFSNSTLMTLYYGMAHKGFRATSAYLKLYNKGAVVIDSFGGVKQIEKLYNDLMKKEKLKAINLIDYFNYESDSINFSKNSCDTLIKHYSTYKGDKIIRKKTNDNVVFQFYYSGKGNRIKICDKEKKYDIQLDSIERYGKENSSTILLKDITGDGKEELFIAERVTRNYWDCEGFYINIYEVDYPKN